MSAKEHLAAGIDVTPRDQPRPLRFPLNARTSPAGLFHIANRNGPFRLVFRPAKAAGACRCSAPPLVQDALTVSDRQPSEPTTLGRLCEYASRLLEVARVEKLVQPSAVLGPALDFVGLVH